MKRFTIFFTLLFLIINIFLKHNIITNNIIISSKIFVKSIVPSIFPMFIISSLLINLNFIQLINKIFHKLSTKLLKISSSGLYVFLMSMISGFPSGAKIANDLYKNKCINKDEIKKIILYSHFANPLFIINIIPNKWYIVLISHYLSGFIIALLYRNIRYSKSNNSYIINTDLNLSEVLNNSIRSSINTLLFIYGCLLLFSTINSIIDIPCLNIFLELSNGLIYINNLNIEYFYKLVLIGSLFSFGGFCVHFQIYGILSSLNIKYYPYLLTRIFHSMLTIIIIYLFNFAYIIIGRYV